MRGWEVDEPCLAAACEETGLTKAKLIAGGRQFLKIATDILPKLPQKNDSAFQLVVKAFAMWDTVARLTSNERASELQLFCKENGLKSVTNKNFINVFLQSDVSTLLFEKEEIKFADNTLELIHFGSKEYGNLYCWPKETKVNGYFFVDKKFNFDILEKIFDFYPHGICFDVSYDDDWNLQASYSHISESIDPTSKSAEKILTEFSGHHSLISKDKRSRVYLFIGVPGTGKSTMAYRFASQSSKRILKITSEGFVTMKGDFFHFMLENMHPDIIIVDDIDRSLYSSKLLHIMEEIPKRYPWLTVFFTANKLDNLDTALIRPGRIDEVVEFELPNKAERIELLKLYLGDTVVEDKYINDIANITDGMSQAWMKEVAVQMKYDSPEKLIARIGKMLALIGKSRERDGEEPLKKRKKKALGPASLKNSKVHLAGPKKGYTRRERPYNAILTEAVNGHSEMKRGEDEDEFA